VIWYERIRNPKNGEKRNTWERGMRKRRGRMLCGETERKKSVLYMVGAFDWLMNGKINKKKGSINCDDLVVLCE